MIIYHLSYIFILWYERINIKSKEIKVTTNDRRTKLLPKIITGQLFFGTLIIGIAAFLISYAAGYRFDLENFRFEKTGVLYFNVLPSNAKLFINNKNIDKRYPIAKNFKAGTYEVVIRLDGYQDWNRTLSVKPDGVYSFERTVLFKENPAVMALTDTSKIDSIVSSNTISYDSTSKLYADDYEIFIDNNLVARFSEKISNVKWYSDRSHVIFQQGREIRVIDIDGSNDKLLATLENDNNSMFVVGNFGKELYFIDGTEYRIAYIF